MCSKLCWLFIRHSLCFESIVLYFWLILSKPRPGERFSYRAACKRFTFFIVFTLRDVVANTRAGFEFRTNPDKPKQSGVRKSISKKSWCWPHRWFCTVNQLVRSSRLIRDSPSWRYRWSMEIFKIHKTELYYLEVNSEKTIIYVWLKRMTGWLIQRTWVGYKAIATKRTAWRWNQREHDNVSCSIRIRRARWRWRGNKMRSRWFVVRKRRERT